MALTLDLILTSLLVPMKKCKILRFHYSNVTFMKAETRIAYVARGIGPAKT